MNPDEKIRALVDKWRDNLITPEEEVELMLLFDLYSNDELYELFKADARDLDSLIKLDTLPFTESQSIAASIIRQCAEERKARMKFRVNSLKKWLRAAVAFILLVVLGVILYEYAQEKQYNNYCGIINENMEIPTSNFSATLQTGSQSYELNAKDTGILKRYHNLELYNLPGVITYRTKIDTERNKPSQDIQEISTKAQQQYLVQLPNSVLLRLNAQTRVQLLPDTIPGILRVSLLQGSLYVKVPSQEKEFTITTSFNNTKTKNSDFVVKLNNNSAQIAVFRGTLQTFYHSQKVVNLAANDVSGLYKIYSAFYTKDTIVTERNIDVSPLLSWTKISREYKNVPLRYFVEEIGIWYGLKFEKTECLPNQIINARICYKAPLTDFFSVLERNNVKVYHTPNGGYAFCEPEPLKLKIETKLPAVAMNNSRN